MPHAVTGVTRREGDALDICKAFTIFYSCLRSSDGLYSIRSRYPVLIMRIDPTPTHVYRPCSIFKVLSCGHIRITFHMPRHDFEPHVLFYFLYYWCFLRFGTCKHLSCLKLHMLTMYDISSDLPSLPRNS